MKISRAALPVAVCISGFLVFFLLWPIWHVFTGAFSDDTGFTFFYMANLFSDTIQIQAVVTSFVIACLVTLCCFAVSVPLGWLMARRSFFGKQVLSALLLVPLILPPFVGAVALKTVFARCGALSVLMMKAGLADSPVDWFGSFPLTGVVILETLHLFPVMYLNVAAALANVDPSMEDAALNSGASPHRVFGRVTLPLAWPGIFAGSALVFIWSFTELGTPLVFGIRRVLPVMVYDNVSEIGRNPMGYAQVVFMLVIAVAGFALAKSGGRRGGVATMGRAVAGRVEKRLGWRGALFAQSMIILLLLAALLPHISVTLVGLSKRWFLTVLPEGLTFEYFRRAMTSELTKSALVNSMILATGATVIDLFAGFAVAWMCIRRRIPGAWILDAIAMLPLAVPGIVIAFGYMGCFTGGVFQGTALDPRLNPMILLAAGYAVRRLPYMVRAAFAGLEQTSPTYEDAAMNLGASPLKVVRRITLPLISANLLAGGILCFAFSMLEVSDSLILAQTERFYPLTKAIYVLMESLESGVNVASALGLWAMMFLGAAMLWVSSLLGRRMGQMFRAG